MHSPSSTQWNPIRGGNMRQVIVCLAFAVGLMCLAPGQGRAQSAPQAPDANGINILVRTTIIALNHANRTGNYTVFRDLGAPAFQKTNTAAKLASIYTNLRTPYLDFSPVVLFNPKFTKQPALNKQRMLRLTGYFPTSPVRVHFDLIYQWIEKRWQVFGIAVQTGQAPAAAKTR